jgi:hypothetical protein
LFLGSANPWIFHRCDMVLVSTFMEVSICLLVKRSFGNYWLLFFPLSSSLKARLSSTYLLGLNSIFCNKSISKICVISFFRISVWLSFFFRKASKFLDFPFFTSWTKPFWTSRVQLAHRLSSYHKLTLVFLVLI